MAGNEEKHPRWPSCVMGALAALVDAVPNVHTKGTHDLI